MVVNSLPFLFFFVIVFSIYFLPIVKKNKNYQNIWLLLCSYFFYGYANLKIVPLLLIITVIFFWLGKYLKKTMDKEKWDLSSYITTFGVCLGIGLLLYFKYLNFFCDSFAKALNSIGLNVTWSTLHIILPIGVSFFTFKLISYIIEIHRERIEPTDDFVSFALYIAFFPTILSGPIDRPNTFLPQLQHEHDFDYSSAVDGCRQILWGMFTKMCIADNLSEITDKGFNNFSTYNGFALLLISFLYTIQMYADFAGYSNMAIGVGKILGFKVTKNFNHPLLARNVADFWRRWHISLTSWITDYVFMPLNFSFRNLGKFGIICAILINLIVIGFWHGANWTYGLYGLYHGILFIPLIMGGHFGKQDKLEANKWNLPKFTDFIKMFLTFTLVTLGLVIFKAPTITYAAQYIYHIFADFSIMTPHLGVSFSTSIFILVLILIEWIRRDCDFELEINQTGFLQIKTIRRVVYLLLCLSIIFFSGNQTNFIYFQF